MSSTILTPTRPKPLKGGMLNKTRGMWVMPEQNEAPRRPPPPLHNADLPDTALGGAEWSEWRRLRGDGLLSWFRWLWDHGVGLTQEERSEAHHYDLMGRHECHRYHGYTYCFHRDPHIHPELKNVPTDAPIPREGEA